MKPTKQLSDLVALMAHLRIACPWDKKQTPHSLLPYLLEESYEVIDATHAGDTVAIKEELGDVLLQVVFAAQIYAEQGDFDLGDVIYTLMDKLIRRHRHVFEGETLADEEALKQRWDEIKAQEKQNQKPKADFVAQGTALMQAQSMQKYAAKAGFDWQDLQGILAKLDEEVQELKAVLPNAETATHDLKAASQDNLECISDELGDCFFVLTNIAQKCGVDSELATLWAIQKFKSRFGFVLDALAKQGKSIGEVGQDELDTLWCLAKAQSQSQIKAQAKQAD